jgi:hypothetical protein
MKFNETKEVKVIGFVTNRKMGKCNPVPNDYLSSEKNVPDKLIDEMKTNGWSDELGNIWWAEDFQPKPQYGNDGNVYLCLSDKDMENPNRYFKQMKKALKMSGAIT